MRVTNAVEGLVAALGSLVGMASRRSLATNSLKLSFDFRERDKGRAYIWIDPPWRLSLSSRFVTGSYNWPEWDGVADPAINQPRWEAWCALFEPLDQSVLADFSIGRDFPDLRLRFASGHVVETFGNDGDGVWWYYRDRLTGECFEASAGGVVRELGEPAEGKRDAVPKTPG